MEFSERPELADKSFEELQSSLNNFDTILGKEDDRSFQSWKQQHAPKDSGFDYDLRGAFMNGDKASEVDGHWPDTWKKPNHPTFSDQSVYAPYGNPGSWDGDTYIPHGNKNLSPALSEPAPDHQKMSFEELRDTFLNPKAAPEQSKSAALSMDGIPSVDATTPEAKTFTEKVKQTWPVQIVKDLIDTAKLPGDVYAGKVDLSSEEGQQRVFGLALNASMAGSLKMGTKTAESLARSSSRIDEEAFKKESPEIYKAWKEHYGGGETPALKATYDTTDEALAKIADHLEKNWTGKENQFLSGSEKIKQFDKDNLMAEYKKWDAANPSDMKKGFFNPLTSKLDDIQWAFQDKMDNLVGSFKAKWLEKTQKAAYENNMKEIDFKDIKAGIKAETPNAVANPSELGFNTDQVLYKGKTGAALHNEFASLPDPGKKTIEKGLFFSDNFIIAKQYGDVEKFVVRSPKTYEVDFKKATGSSEWDPAHTSAIINMAREKGADMVVFKNMNDLGGASQSQYVLLKPENARKLNARFDPIHLHSGNLVAGLAAAGYLGKEVLNSSD